MEFRLSFLDCIINWLQYASNWDILLRTFITFRLWFDSDGAHFVDLKKKQFEHKFLNYLLSMLTVFLKADTHSLINKRKTTIIQTRLATRFDVSWCIRAGLTTMARLRPVNQFCCGCTLTFGMQAILGLHFIASVFFIAVSFSNIILQLPSIGHEVNLAMQTANAAYFLLGIPFIIAAWYGVRWRLESPVRLYLYFTCLTFLIDIVLIFIFLFDTDTCSLLPGSMRSAGGSAFT